MKTFESYWKRALANCGGEAALAAKLPELKSAKKNGVRVRFPLIAGTGFRIDAIESLSLPGTPCSVGFNFWGTAAPG